MNHQDITQLVESMEVLPLTKDTFEDFVQNAHGLFVSKGLRFQELYSAGYNELSKTKYDFSKGKPEYRDGGVLVFDRIEPREIPEQGKKWINVYFRNETHDFPDTGVWGISHSDRLPLKFGFAPDKALYIAQEEGNGTPEFPWEQVYLRLEQSFLL
jgi:hypothetical protein